MKFIVTVILLVLGAGPAALAAHLDDPGRLLPADPAWHAAVEARLESFERSAGIRILVRYHLQSPSAEEDKIPGAYMSELAEKLGTRRHGVLVVYFADDPDWRVWIGDELTATFAGRPGTVKELTDSGAIHDVKEALLTAAKARADAAGQQDGARDKDRQLARQTDALLDGLLARLAPRS